MHQQELGGGREYNIGSACVAAEQQPALSAPRKPFRPAREHALDFTGSRRTEGRYSQVS